MTQARLPAAPLRWLPYRSLTGMALTAALVGILATGCQGSVATPGPGGTPGGSGGSGGATGADGGVPVGTGGAHVISLDGGTGPAACVPSTPEACTGSEIMATKRLVRLTFNQVTNSIRSLLGDTLATAITKDFEIVDANHRWFPPLSNPREGTVVTDTPWDIGDRMAQQASKYVLDNFAAVTACTGATVTDACAQTFVRAFAARAYRRPLTAEETTEINKVYTDVKGFGGTIQEATQFGVYAALDSPNFLYRSEFGGSATAMGPLTPHELASSISYFLTDGPPDTMLTAAASQNMLSTDAQLRAHVNRILAAEPARQNLHGAMMGYFDITNLEDILIDSTANPRWNDGVRSSMYRESELFLRNTLWGGKVADLLTSRRSPINETLAPIYGVSWPPAGVQLDADGFGTVELPATRAGMLTQGGFLVARARPMAGSVVGRGLLVNAAFLCNVNPPFPTALSGEIQAANALLHDAPEKEKMAFRTDKSRVCAGCHINFDAYGLVLENFDTIGQYRTVDDHQRPVDTAVTLPAKLGCAEAANAAELAAKLASSNAFTACLAKNVMSFALAEHSSGAGTQSCATKAIVDRFLAAGEGTFTSLVREIAVSQTLSARNPGGAQ